MESATEPRTTVDKLILIFDPSEEIDDELAIDECYKYAEIYRVYIILVDGKVSGEDRLERVKQICGLNDKCTYYTSNRLKQKSQQEVEELFYNSSVLQAAPLELPDLRTYKLKIKHITFVGTWGNCVNSGIEGSPARINAEYLRTCSKNFQEIESGHLTEYTITLDIIHGLSDNMIEAIACLLYRFLCGRAIDKPAEYVAHLLSPTLAEVKKRKASNFNAIQIVYKTMNEEVIPGPVAKNKAIEFADRLKGFEEYCKEKEVEVNRVLNEYAVAFQMLLNLEFRNEDNCLISSSDKSLKDDEIKNGEHFHQILNYVRENGCPLPPYDLIGFQKFIQELKK